MKAAPFSRFMIEDCNTFSLLSHFVNSVVRWGIFFDEPPQHRLLDIYNLSIRLHLL